MDDGNSSGSASLRSQLSTATAALGIIGILGFALFSLLLAWVYEPTGVSPHEVGLSSGALVGQAASGLAAFLLLTAIPTIVLVVGWTVWQLMHTPELSEARELIERSSNSEAQLTTDLLAAFPEQGEPEVAKAVEECFPFPDADLIQELSAALPSLREADIATTVIRSKSQGRIAASTFVAAFVWGFAVKFLKYAAVIGLIFALTLTAFVAASGRKSIDAGRQPGFILGLPLPWSARTAKIRPVTGSTSNLVSGKLPSCALYLGESDGVVVLRIGPARKTLRVPSSTVILDLEDHQECPHGKS
jgi:hypothetical protein